jgi:hypothetical protein
MSGKKIKGDSNLNGLLPEQRAQVERWLFVEEQTYKEVAEKCRREFGLITSMTSVHRYYHAKKLLLKLNQLGRDAQNVEGMDSDPQRTYESVLQGVESMALEMARCSREEVKARDLSDLVHLLIAARREANEASRVALAREKLEYDVATACLMHKIEMDRICEDKSMDDGERIQAIREELFGPNLPE